MLELILRVDWALIMHKEKENHSEQELYQNGQKEPSCSFSLSISHSIVVQYMIVFTHESVAEQLTNTMIK